MVWFRISPLSLLSKCCFPRMLACGGNHAHVLIKRRCSNLSSELFPHCEEACGTWAHMCQTSYSCIYTFWAHHSSGVTVQVVWPRQTRRLIIALRERCPQYKCECTSCKCKHARLENPLAHPPLEV